MGKQNGSIAGRVHGAKSAEPEAHTQRYYPQTDGVENIHPEVAKGLKVAYDYIYQLRDDSQKSAKASKASSGSGDSAKTDSDSPAYSTGILGVQYKATTDPAGLPHAGNPTYNSASGQFEFSTPAGFAPAPANASAPGTPGQIAHDGTNFYVCIGKNSWMKTALSSF